eukprot:PITA_20233
MKMKSMIHFRLEFCVAVALFASPSFSQTGFISLDCGGTKSYNNSAGIQWITDDGYIDVGEKSIVPNVAGVTTSIQMNSLRKFPERNKNCYDITPLQIGTKYLLRATFLYANYDGLASPPTFVLMLDADVWITVTLTESDVTAKELIFMAKFNSSSVCLGRQSNGGVPIISSLELRPPEETMYWPVSQDYSLFRLENTNFGAPNDSSDIRYPDDPFDRLWSPSANKSALPNIITNEKVSTGAAKDMPPSLVMQTADRSPRNYVFPHRKSSRDGNLYISMYFAELKALNDTSIREFDLYLDNNKLGGTIQPRYLESSNVSVLMPYGITTQMAFRVQATNRSTLPPIFNALEIYRESDLRQNGTFAQDVRALREIQLDINFTYASAGDACLPANFSWDWLGCNSDVSPRITSLLSGNPLLCEGNANQCTKSKPGIRPNALEQLADWKTRLDIALNAAQGLEYLHNGCKPIIIHRDIKATNILLSERMEAKLSDFGLSRAAALNRYATTRNLTEKSDVYSFGVVIFEIISGREPVDTNVSGENSHIVSWGRSMIGEGNIEGILDKRAVREVNMSAMWKVAELAMLCTENQPNQRPTMNEVVSELKESIRLLNATDLLDRKLVHHPTFSAAGSSISTTKPSAR